MTDYVNRVPDPLEPWEYLSAEEIEALIAKYKAEFEAAMPNEVKP
jgi:hypothetical protein